MTTKTDYPPHNTGEAIAAANSTRELSTSVPGFCHKFSLGKRLVAYSLLINLPDQNVIDLRIAATMPQVKATVRKTIPVTDGLENRVPRG